MVEQVEEFGPELQAHPLTQHEILDGREVGVYKTWTRYWGTGSGSQFSDRSLLRSARVDHKSGRFHECAGIEPVLQGVNLGRTTCLSSHIPALVRVAYLDRSVESGTAVPEEGHARLVVAVDHKQWKARNCPLDYVDGPIAENSIGNPIPIATDMLAPSKGQVVEHACGELTVRIKGRERPVRLLRARQRPVNRSWERPESVRQPGIESSGPCVSQQGIEPMARTFGLSLDLERVIAGAACVVVVEDVEEIRNVRRGSYISATQGVARDRSAGSWRVELQVQAIYQNVRAARAGVSGCEHKVARELVFDVEVVLLNRALLEVEIL